MDTVQQNWIESDVNKILFDMLYKLFTKWYDYNDSISKEVADGMIRHGEVLVCNCEHGICHENKAVDLIKHTEDICIADISFVDNIDSISQLIASNTYECVCFKLPNVINLSEWINETLPNLLSRLKNASIKIYIWFHNNEYNKFYIKNANSDTWTFFCESELYDTNH